MSRFRLPYLSISRSGKRDTSSNAIKVNNSEYTLSPPRQKFYKEPLSLQKVFEEDFYVRYYRSLQKIGLVVRWETKHFVGRLDKNVFVEINPKILHSIFRDCIELAF